MLGWSSCCGDCHPELGHEEARVARLLAAEEERFSRTLETGGKLLDDVIAGSGDEVPADEAFRLHDTYGFPIELTVEIAGEHGKRVDEAGFATLMDEQRHRARAAAPPARASRCRRSSPTSRRSSWATSGST